MTVPHPAHTWVDGEIITAGQLNALEVDLAAVGASSPTGLAPVATTGAYADLTGKPTLGTAAAQPTTAFDAAGAASAAQAAAVQRANHTGTQAASTITGLATVATTGSYTDLSNKPVIGSAGTAGAALSATDPSTTNARTPTAHASTHASGGSDAVTPSAIGAHPAKNGLSNLTVPLSDYFTRVEVIDDGSSTTSWPNRFEAAFTPSGGTRGLTTYLNEYGELRVEPAKANTVAARFFTKHQPGDAAHTVNVFEVMDDRTTRTLLLSIDASGNLKAPNLPGRITVASTAPSSPAVNDVWIDLSA